MTFYMTFSRLAPVPCIPGILKGPTQNANSPNARYTALTHALWGGRCSCSSACAAGGHWDGLATAMPELVMTMTCTPAASEIEGNAAADGGTTSPSGCGGCTLPWCLEFVRESPGLKSDELAAGGEPPAASLHSLAAFLAYLFAVSMLRSILFAASTQTSGIECRKTKVSSIARAVVGHFVCFTSSTSSAGHRNTHVRWRRLPPSPRDELTIHPCRQRQHRPPHQQRRRQWHLHHPRRPRRHRKQQTCPDDYGRTIGSQAEDKFRGQ